MTDESGSNNWTALESLFKKGGALSNYGIWLDLSNLTDIPSDGFSGTSGITKLTAIKGAIGGSAFSSVSSIKEVIIPQGTTTIGAYAFALCLNMEILIIGSDVKNIGRSSFGNCYKLENIKFLGVEEPIFGDTTFTNVFTSVCVPNDYAEDKFGPLDVVRNCQ